MQSWFETGAAAFQLLAMLVIGWLLVFLVTRVVEGRLRGKRGRGSGSALGAIGWLWAYSNLIGIPTLVFGAGYLIWAMTSSDAGLGAGPTMLVILLMTVAGLLIGFGPGLRR